MHHQLVSILTVIAILLVVGSIGRFIYELIRLPRGSLTNALAQADYNSDEDDESNPILRNRRIARAQGVLTPIR